MIPEVEVSIIVVSYNTREMTLECLRSIYDQTKDLSYEVIVVDNASADGSAQAITEQFQETALLALNENLGFGRANNLAVQQATGEYILLLNPDTVVLDGAVQKLHAFAKQHPKAGIWGGRSFYADMSLSPGSCWQFPSLWSMVCSALGLNKVWPNSEFFNSEAYGGWQRDTVRPVDMVTGCFLLITRSLWDELGGFDPKFFMYGEDADLNMRAIKLGYQPLINPDATIIHHGGASETIRADQMVRILKARVQLIAAHWHPARTRWAKRLLLLHTAWRYTTLGTLAFLRIRRFQNPAAAWQDIWRRRDQWLLATGEDAKDVTSQAVAGTKR